LEPIANSFVARKSGRVAPLSGAWAGAAKLAADPYLH
jgi:hypothetical protein